MTDQPRCQQQNKAGEPCGAFALQGKPYCIAHSPKEEQESRGFGGSQPGAGRPRRPKHIDALRQRIEEQLDDYLEPIAEALAAERAVVVGNGPTARVEMVPDYVTRLKAAAMVFDYGWGKPKQITEISGPEGGPVQVAEIEIPDTEAFRRQVAELAARVIPTDGGG